MRYRKTVIGQQVKVKNMNVWGIGADLFTPHPDIPNMYVGVGITSGIVVHEGAGVKTNSRHALVDAGVRYSPRYWMVHWANVQEVDS